MDEFDEGEVVALKIPRELRTSTDNIRLFCVIVHRPHKNSYELRCRHGILDRNFPTKNLERVPDTVAKGLDIPFLRKKISLAMAAEAESTSDRVRVSCQCTGQCSTRRCRCYKEDLRCSVHCHMDEQHVCENLSTLLERTEISLRQKQQRANTKGDAIAIEDTITIGATGPAQSLARPVATRSTQS